MRLQSATALCILLAGCATAPAPDNNQQAAADTPACRSEAQTGSHLSRRNDCKAVASDADTQRRVDDIQQEQQRMNLPRPGGMLSR